MNGQAAQRVWAKALHEVTRQLKRQGGYGRPIQVPWELIGDPTVAAAFQRSYARYSEDEEATLMGATAYAFTALCYLPAPAEAPIDLQLLANGIVGDTHAFDADRIGGRYLTLLLEAHYGAAQEINPSEARATLYRSAGIDVGRTASTVMVSSLVTHDGEAEKVIGDGHAVLLPRASVDALRQIAARGDIVFAFENPTVLQSVLELLLANPHARPLPMLLCTWGWPSIAARTLLDRFTAETTLYYSGDLDHAGVRIADWMEDRYSKHLNFKRWHMAPSDYQLGVASNWPGPLWTDDQLNDAAARHPDLVERIREFELPAAVNQETLLSVLWADVRDAALGVER